MPLQIIQQNRDLTFDPGEAFRFYRSHERVRLAGMPQVV